jgi:hypothetical protein
MEASDHLHAPADMDVVAKLKCRASSGDRTLVFQPTATHFSGSARKAHVTAVTTKALSPFILKAVRPGIWAFTASFIIYILYALCEAWHAKWPFLQSGVYSQSSDSSLCPASHRQQTTPPHYKNSLTWSGIQRDKAFWVPPPFFKASRVLASLTDHTT